ncbi:tRNA (adenine(22)-N(1))-methyltransferase [Crassaminicella profunda]|uniref:tRNA (adenine(22)-N(1))-methyltransferase n=1 Tax=Crassaminicella profunda TaxID=1286698 RepID=UPI001CA6D58B|nr:class I SAM-dependent methyltransferase [Crassaminicella profunda]QZY56570.1 class I SAM-dependent methyltransferase [Crassaminicella profunda]
MKLTPRLLNIAKLVPKGSILADVGTDHGYIPVYLMKNKIVEKTIATDVNKGPLLSAQKNIKNNGLEDSIETRLGNGLEPIEPEEIDTVIIAGMGGLLIRDILMNHPKVTKSIKRFILQPMVAQDELRRWLCNNHFKIVEEKLVSEDHRIYEILVVEHGKDEIENEIYFEIGKKLIENKDPLLEIFIKKHIKKQNDIINNLIGQETDKAKNKLNQCKEKIHEFEEVLRWLKN